MTTVTAKQIDFFCDVCGHHIDADQVDWKETPGRGEKHPPLFAPTHKGCAYHTCETEHGEPIAP